MFTKGTIAPMMKLGAKTENEIKGYIAARYVGDSKVV
jgi:hypothetical protein